MPDAENANNHATSNSGPTYQFGSVHGDVHVGRVGGTQEEGGDLPFIDVSPPEPPEGAGRIPRWDTAAALTVEALKAAPGPRVLHGPAGVGTSTVAAVVAERTRRDLGWPVFWISPGRRLHGLLHTACALSGSAGGRARELLWSVPEDGISWARGVVGSHRAPALIVIDGADGGPGGNGAERAVAGGWERIGGECRVLLTGRTGGGTIADRRHELAPLEDGAAYALLHERIPPRDAEEGRVLEEAVAGCRGLPRRLSAVLSVLSAADEDRAERTAELLRTWEHLDALLSGPQGAERRRVLEVLAAVGADKAPGGVPRRWCGPLKADSGSASEREAERTLEFLEERHLLTVMGKGPRGAVELDALVGRCMRTGMGPVHAAETALGVLEFWAGHDVPVDRDGLQRVGGLYTSVPGAGIRAEAALGLAELEAVGRTATERAEALFTRVSERMQAARVVVDDALRVRLRVEAGRAWAACRRWKRQKAVGALNRIAADQMDALGPGHPDTLASEAVHALLVHAFCDHHWSEQVYARIMEPLADVFGEDHYRVLSARYDVIGARAARGDYAGAEAEMRVLADRCEAVLGPEHHLTKHARGAARQWGLFKHRAVQVPVKAVLDVGQSVTRRLARRVLD